MEMVPNSSQATKQTGIGTRRTTLFVMVAFVCISLSRLPVLIIAHPNRLMNDSELEMTFSALDRFLGVPSSTLIWPAATLQMLSVPVFLSDFLAQSHFSVSPTAFVGYLAKTYREPWHALLLLRIAVALVSSICFATFLFPFSRIFASHLVGFLSVICFATVPSFWLYSQMAVPDLFAFGLASFAVGVILLGVTKRSLLLAGTVYGLAIASKVTVIPLFPFMLGLFLQKSKSKFLDVSLFVGGICSGFGIGCPFLWTDPVRLVKTIIGNAVRHGVAKGWEAAGASLLEILPFWLLTSFLLSLAWLIWRKQHWVFGGAIITVLVSLKILADAGVAFPRYLFPIVPVACVSSVMFLSGLAELDYFYKRPVLLKRCVVFLLISMILGNVALFCANAQDSMKEFSALTEISKDLKEVKAGRVIVPFDNFFYYFAGNASSDSLKNLGDECSRIAYSGDVVSSFVSTKGLAREAVETLPRVFDAQEQAFIAQTRIMSYPRGQNGIILQIWARDEVAPRFGFLSQDKAIDLFRSGEVDAVIVRKVPDDLKASKAYTGKWYLLARLGLK